MCLTTRGSVQGWGKAIVWWKHSTTHVSFPSKQRKSGVTRVWSENPRSSRQHVWNLEPSATSQESSTGRWADHNNRGVRCVAEAASCTLCCRFIFVANVTATNQCPSKISKATSLLHERDSTWAVRPVEHNLYASTFQMALSWASAGGPGKELIV